MVKKAVVYAIIVAVTVSLVVTITGCEVTITGSGNLDTREMDYSDFNKLEVGWAFEVDVIRGNSYGVIITADDNLFEHLDIGKRGDTLRIDLKGPIIPINTTQKATITMPDLRELNISGASKARVTGFVSEDPLELDVSGASSLFMDGMEAGDTEFDISGASRVSGNIKTANCDFDVSGASTVELGGSATDVSIEGSGASHVRVGDFSVTDVQVNLSGASDATVNASGKLEGGLSGASRLYYIGNPTLGRISTSGGSTVSQK